VSLWLAGNGYGFNWKMTFVLVFVVWEYPQSTEFVELVHPRGYQLNTVLWSDNSDGDGLHCVMFHFLVFF
jgi:hypothetical protein